MPEPQDIAQTADGNGQPCPPSFEQALDELEQIVHQLEEGDVGLAAGLEHYEKGIGLLKQCYALLERAERRIELLSGVDAAGNPITEPLADETMSLEEKSQNRARRRTKPKTKPVADDRADEVGRMVDEVPDSAEIRFDEPGSLF
ncbi:MAG TPA: exodeoxyribonuclease VII small subunit [Pirellulales bacterium]|nr:exodeoxyribonuclease VII small subunit [Pirellulales bacterium]